MDPFPSPAGCWVKQRHHHSTLITLNTNLLKRQMDPTGKRRKRECFMRLTCTDRSGKGRGSQDTHTQSCFQNFSTHYMWNTQHKFGNLVTVPAFTSKFWVCCVPAWAGSWELSLFVVTNTQKRQSKVVFSSVNQQRQKAEPRSHEKSVLLCCAKLFGVRSNQSWEHPGFLWKDRKSQQINVCH